MTTTLDIAALASAIFYPIALIIIFFILRKELPLILNSIVGRLTKVKIGAVSLELAKATSFNPNWTKEGTLDLRHKAEAFNVNDSTQGNFLEQLKVSGASDYAIVNLGEGKEWLTSRLYIMAIIFSRMKGIKGIIFLETTVNTRNKFVGWAKPEIIRWKFAQRYPWLESSFSEAYYITLCNVNNTRIVSDQGRLGYLSEKENPNPSIELLKKFLEGVQSPQSSIILPEIEWVSLSSNKNNDIITCEHAQWLNAELLEEILNEDLIKVSIKLDSNEATKERQIKHSLSLSHHFIAVVREDYQFDYLVKREKLMEQVLVK